MLGETIYCALASVLLSSDVGKNLSLRQPRELLHCLGKKKKDSYFITNIIMSVPHFITALYTREHSAPSYHICLPCWLSLLSRLNSSARTCSFHTELFQIFLQELDATHHDIFLYDNVRWSRKEGELKCSSGWEYNTEGYLSKQQYPFTTKSLHGFQRTNVKHQFLEMLLVNQIMLILQSQKNMSKFYEVHQFLCS